MKEYICIKDYYMSGSDELAYKKGESYYTDGVINNAGYFIMPSLFDETHQMDTSSDFYEYFIDINIVKEDLIKEIKKLNVDCNWKTWSSTPSGDMFLDEFIGNIEVKEPEILNNDSIVAKVIESFKERSNVGFKKYGTNLDRKDLSPLEWINHFQQELQDAILYAEKLKEDLPTQSPRVMVIHERDHSDNEEIVIGVASDRKNALRIIEEYYGKESTMSEFKDVRDSGLDFTVNIEVPGGLGGKYSIWVEDFYINEI